MNPNVHIGGAPAPDERRRDRIRYVALALVACVTIAANAVLFRQIDRQLDVSYTAEADSTVWNMSQVEVELLRFGAALAAVRLSPEDPSLLADLRLQYDLLYSRVQLVDRQDRLSGLPLAQSGDWQFITGPQGVVPQALPLIDGPDAALLAAVPALHDQVRAALRAIRDEVVASAIQSIRDTESQRRDLHAALQIFAAVSLGLMGVMAGLMIVIYRQGRARESHRRALAQAVYNLRTTIDSSLEAAVILDHEGRIVGCNKAGTEMFGGAESAAGLRHFSDVVRDAGRGAGGLSELIAACAASDGAGRIIRTGIRPDGTTFPLELSLAQAESAAGLPIAIAFLRDISDRVEREEALRRARNAALEAEEAKSRFLAMIGHEMRTPLNGLLSAVELLKAATELSPKQASLLRIIENGGRKTLEQVNNVLDMTLLQHGHGTTLPETAFSLSELIQSVAQSFAAEAQERGNKIAVTVTGVEPEQVMGAGVLVSRILTNLVSNAVKFTENGLITIGLDCQPGQSPDTVALRLVVVDTGVGIDEADKDRIFKTFETLDASYARLREGSGLGLGLAKLAAEAMGGRITVASHPGEGSTFALYLTLPVAAGAKPPRPAGLPQQAVSETEAAPVAATADNGEVPPRPQALPADQQGLRLLTLLVVEDNPVNRELLAEVLRLKGHRVLEATNGAEGVAMAEASRPDAILMDISMPVMDGVEASRVIRAGQTSRDVPIIAVTANADMSRHGEFLAAGINEVLHKPVDFARLEQALKAHLHDRSITVYDPEEADDGAARLAEDPVDRAILDEEVYVDLLDALGHAYMKRMAGKLSDETEQTLQALVTCEQAGAMSEAAQVAHRSAGAVASMGLRALHAALVTYEHQAKAGDADAASATRGQIALLRSQTFDALRQRGLLS